MPGLRPHGLDQWLDELALFTEWYCPALGLDVDAHRLSHGLGGRARRRSPPTARGPVTVLRDYHAENIMLVAGRDGIAPFGLLDFQDALAGHPAYDLVSVLEDARRDVTPAIERGDARPLSRGDGAGRRLRDALIGCWRRSATPGSSASSPGCGSATASRIIALSSRACGACWSAISRIRRWRRCPRLVRRQRACGAAGRGLGRRRGGMSRYRKPLALRPDPVAAVPRTAMVMAAGLGKRMRPLTATRPKPLVEVAGQHADRSCARPAEGGGVGKVVVNVHYLADALEAHLKNRVEGIEIAISDERKQLLETGGGLVKALPLIDADPFLVVNTDNLWVDGPVDTLAPARGGLGRRAGWTRCCCWCRSRAPIATAAAAIST